MKYCSNIINMDTKKCGKCLQVKSFYNFRLQYDKRAKGSDGKRLCSWCKDCEKRNSLDKYYENRKHRIAQSKIYKKHNKDKINETRRKYTREKMKDVVERIKRDLKCLLTAKIKKTKHSNEYLGTPIHDIVKWLEWNFEDDMNWENHGKIWQIDHTIAINTFNLLDEDQCMICFNWKNLIPMYISQNARKSDIIVPYRVFYQEHRLRKFFNLYHIEEDLKTFIAKYKKHFQEQWVTQSNCGKALRVVSTTLC